MDKINFIVKDNDKTDFSIEAKGSIKVYPPLSNIEITPTKETQVFKNSEKYGYDQVTVNPIPENYIDPNGTLTIKENGVKNVREYQNVIVDVPEPEMPEIKLQDKEVTPTKEMQNIKASSDYVGLNSVVVNPIPDEYIIPNGTLDINANGETDVTMFRMARIGVHTPPTLQDKSVTITENGIQNISADEGYDGLGNVEVNVNVEATAEGITHISNLPTLINNTVTEQLKNIVDSYPTYTNTPLTLYTPSESATNYVIRKRGENQYGIVWFTCKAIYLKTNYINPAKVTLSSITISNAITETKLTTTTAKMLGYMSPNYTSFEECVEAIQDSSTTYTESTSLDWGNKNDGDYSASATNMPTTSTANLRRLSSNETIEVIS